MSIKFIGAICVIVGCGGFGFVTTMQFKNKIHVLRELLGVLNYMTCELQFRNTALPSLCRQAAERCQGIIRRLFADLATELDAQISPDAYRCMVAMLDQHNDVPGELRHLMTELGHGLGNFDLSGQLRCIDDLRTATIEQLDKLLLNKDSRLRSYQTLGLCAGAAIAILFV